MISLDAIRRLDDLNYESWIRWKNDVEFALCFADLDLALRKEEPVEPPRDSSDEKGGAPYEEWVRSHEKWERSNRLSLLMMKLTVSDGISFLVPEHKSGKAKLFLDFLEDFFMSIEKGTATSTLRNMMNMRYDGQGNVREHISKMSWLAARLKDVGVIFPEFLLVQVALDSLPSKFDPIKTAYIVEKDKWNIFELESRCADAELWLSDYDLASSEVGKSDDDDAGSDQPRSMKKRKRDIQCFSCGKKGHMKKDCWQV
ncbi:uncharacterized protein LOC119997353 [Tripterygium wilfordii]|uniref:uncharacterized protein LOC119997353 n=1 Tax=Tripterygium wilfordii TaxID=458696 RepID=UPI0018F83440|nr:uncharacterized protein LOC119997353 [Tripterygium wilfordii]